MSPGRRLLGYVLRYRRDLPSASVRHSHAGRGAHRAVGAEVRGRRPGRGVTRASSGPTAALLALAAVGGVFRFLMRRIIIGASRDIEYDLRNDFFAHLQRLPICAYFQPHRTGDLMSRATNDLNAVRMMIGPAVMYSANTGPRRSSSRSSLMLSIDPRLTLIALMPLPFVSISVKYFGSAIHKRFEAIQAQLVRDQRDRRRRRCPACASSAPTARKPPRSSGSAPPTRSTSAATAG